MKEQFWSNFAEIFKLSPPLHLPVLNLSQEGRKTTSEVDEVIPEPWLAKAAPRHVDFSPVDLCL